MHTVIGSSQVTWAAVILYRVLFPVELAQEEDCIVNTWCKWEKVFLEATSWVLIIEIPHCTSDLPLRCLEPTDVVGKVAALIVWCDVKLCADTVLLEVLSASGLEFRNFIPHTRVIVSSKVLRRLRQFAFIGMDSLSGHQEWKGTYGNQGLSFLVHIKSYILLRFINYYPLKLRYLTSIYCYFF